MATVAVERGARRGRLALAGTALGLALVLAGCSGGSDAETPAPSGSASGSTEGNQVLMDAQQLTTLDQQVTYPKKKAAQVSSSIQTLEPGQETGWHRHRVPVFVYVLEGTITVEYDAGVVKEYPAGTSYLEAQDVFHNGTNKGDDAVRMLNVYLGAKGIKNTVERTP